MSSYARAQRKRSAPVLVRTRHARSIFGSFGIGGVRVAFVTRAYRWRMLLPDNDTSGKTGRGSGLSPVSGLSRRMAGLSQLVQTREDSICRSLRPRDLFRDAVSSEFSCSFLPFCVVEAMPLFVQYKYCSAEMERKVIVGRTQQSSGRIASSIDGPHGASGTLP